MSKNNLKDMMNKRTPLTQPQREVVEPANMYATPQVDKPTSIQVGNTTSTQVDNSTNQQVDDPTSPPTKKSTKPLAEKYTTHLRPDTIKAIKRAAVETDQKDYQIVQQALDAYLNQ